MKKILEAELKAVSGGVTQEENDELAESINDKINKLAEKAENDLINNTEIPGFG